MAAPPPQLGRFIATRRKARGLSMQQLADSVGVSKSVVSDWEHGRMAPKADKLEPLAAALEVSLEDLFALAGHVTPKGLLDLGPYLRARFDELPDEAIEQIKRYVARVRRKYTDRGNRHA